MGEAKRRKKLDPYYGLPPAIPTIIEDISPNSQLEAMLLAVSNDCPSASVFAITLELVKQKRSIPAVCRLVPTSKRKISAQIIVDESPGLSDREMSQLQTKTAQLILDNAKGDKISLYDLYGVGMVSLTRR